MIPVARVACPEYRHAEAALRRALELLGPTPRPLAEPGASLLIKPNLLAAHPPVKAVTTHPAIVAAALAVAADLGAAAVVADSPGLGSVQRVAKVCGVAEVCRRHGVPLVDLGAGPGREVSGPTYKAVRLAEEALEAAAIWNLPKWKTHTMMGLTLGVKNLYGCVPGKLKIAGHFRAGKDAALFARHLLDLDAILCPRLTVLDGVVAMEGAGPSRGTPLLRGLVLAGTDAAALDWEASRLSGFDPLAVPTVRASVDSGRLDPQTVQVRGDPADPLGFRPAPGSPCDWPAPRLLKRLVRGMVSPAPRFSAADCSGCEVCVNACPARALRPGIPPEFLQEECIRCYCCQELCPTGAVAVPRRLAARLQGALRGSGACATRR